MKSIWPKNTCIQNFYLTNHQRISSQKYIEIPPPVRMSVIKKTSWNSKSWHRWTREMLNIQLMWIERCIGSMKITIGVSYKQNKINKQIKNLEEIYHSQPNSSWASIANTLSQHITEIPTHQSGIVKLFTMAKLWNQCRSSSAKHWIRTMWSTHMQKNFLKPERRTNSGENAIPKESIIFGVVACK